MERFKKIETVENKNINYFLPFIFWNSLLPASNWIFAYKAENQKNKFTVIKYVEFILMKIKSIDIIVFTVDGDTYCVQMRINKSN